MGIILDLQCYALFISKREEEGCIVVSFENHHYYSREAELKNKKNKEHIKIKREAVADKSNLKEQHQLYC